MPERLTPEMEQAWRTLHRECVPQRLLVRGRVQGNDPCPVFWAADVRRWCCGCIGQRLLAEIDALRAERDAYKAALDEIRGTDVDSITLARDERS